MTTNTKAENAWKSVEENPEMMDGTPEVDEATEKVENRYSGKMSADTGEMSVSELMEQVG